MVCSKCGIDAGTSKFCPNCGTPIEAVATNYKEPENDKPVCESADQTVTHYRQSVPNGKTSKVKIGCLIALIPIAFLFGLLIRLGTESNSTIPEKNATGAAQDRASARDMVLYDSDNILVEFRGLEKHFDDSYIINIYVENNQDEDFYFILSDVRANGCVVDLSNWDCVLIPSHSKYLAYPNNDYILDNDDLQPYGIDKIDSMDFKINFYKSWMKDKFIEEEIHLEL